MDEAEDKLHSSERRFRAITENGWDAVVLTDARGTIEYVSPSVTRILGYAPADLLGKRGVDAVHPEDRADFLAVAAAMRSGPAASRTVAHRFRHADGSFRWLESRVTNLLEDPAVAAVVTNLHDVTERVRYEEERERLLTRERAARTEAEAANRAKEEFLAVLAHELRNPLAAVQNAVYAARMDSAIAPRSLEIALRQSQHLGRLIGDLLEVSRITQGKIGLQRERLSLGRVVHRALETAGSFLRERGHERIRTHIADDLPDVEADPTRLEQVLINLLDNSSRFTPAEGTIEIIGERRGADAVLVVRDTGRGIAPEVLPRVFDLFVQGDVDDKARGGLGIGLTLVRRLVELHGGTVEARSEGLGRGAEFELTLPAVAPAEAPSADSGAPLIEKGSALVLIVEDNADNAESLATLLRIFGHRVRIAVDGPSALVAAHEERPDVMLVDIGLGGMSGYDVAKEIRADRQLRATNLVALTGYGREEDKRQAAQVGFDRHLTKPVEPEVLLDVIVDCLKTSSTPSVT